MAGKKNGSKLTEKRKHKRKTSEVTVEVVKDGQLHKEKAKNISFSGIYIENADFEKYEIDEEVVLAFESEGGDPYSVEGKIVRKDRQGTGIKFKEKIKPESLQDKSKSQES